MIKFLMDKIVGSKNAREIKKMQPRVAQIAELEPAMKDKSDAELQAYTPAFKQRIANGEALDSILPEAFALVREVGRRRLGMRHYDVQMIGGMVLHRGTIAEMKTGEGKTLVATLPIYLNALTQLVIDDHNRIFTSDGRLLRRIVRDRRYRQAITSAGDGCKAAMDAERWLEEQGVATPDFAAETYA